MILIMTATVCPDKRMGQTALNTFEERKRQYEESLKFYIFSQSFEKIIFCDNSNYNIDADGRFMKYAKENHVELKILFFTANIEECLKRGKGYGEGEILQYAIDKGGVCGEDYFVKVTGRLIVTNIKKIVGVLDERKSYFNIPNRTRRDFADTRMFAMAIRVFEQFFARAYMEVCDNKGYYIEHAYTDVLNISDIVHCNFPVYPRITGVSGTFGGDYTYKEWKCKIKDMLSKVQYYRVRA